MSHDVRFSTASQRQAGAASTCPCRRMHTCSQRGTYPKELLSELSLAPTAFSAYFKLNSLAILSRKAEGMDLPYASSATTR